MGRISTIQDLRGFLSGIITYRGKGIPKWLANSASSKPDIERLVAQLLGCADSMVLAYLWVAIESNYNILVIANNCDADDFVDSLCLLVPGFRTVLDTRGRIADKGLNFTSVIANNAQTATTYAGMAQELMPDRVIVNARGGIDDIFSSSKYGISFIVESMRKQVGMHVVSGLVSGQLRVKPENLHMLDISVILRKHNGKYRIESITEYKWIERGEFKLRAMDSITKRYSNMRIIKDGVLNGDCMDCSKLIDGMSATHAMSKEEALEELERRSMFLSSLCNNGNAMSSKNPLEMYYEIK